MDEYYKEILHKLEEDIRLLEIEAKTDDFFQRIENIIAIIVTCL